MAKRRKRACTTKKKKGEDEENEEDIEEPNAKKVAVTSTSHQEDEISQPSSFSVEKFNIAKPQSVGSEVGFSSHFWCNYCEFSSDTKKELVTHMRQHMAKCSYCPFSSLSRAEIAKHVKCEHAEEAERTMCEVDSSSSGTEHDMDKDPCSACIFCEFMTYSTEHLEKHTTSKHQGMLPKSVAKMISKQISARVRRADALFYSTISSDSADKPFSEVESMSSVAPECNEDKGPIVIESELNEDVKPVRDIKIPPQSPSPPPPPPPKSDVKPSATTLSDALASNNTLLPSEQKEVPVTTTKPVDWKVKVETLYCLACPYSNVAIEKLKCHTLSQHPLDAAASSFNSEGACRLQDVTFFCIKDSCSYSSVQYSDYETHLITCCSKNSLSLGETERLLATVLFIVNFYKKGDVEISQSFLEFSSQYLDNRQPNGLAALNLQSTGQTHKKIELDDPIHQVDSANNSATSALQNEVHSTDQPSLTIPTQNFTNQYSDPQVSSVQDLYGSSLSNFNQHQMVSDQQNLRQTQNTPNDLSALPTTSLISCMNTHSSAPVEIMDKPVTNTNYSEQIPKRNQPVESNIIGNNFDPNSTPTQNFNRDLYNQEPSQASFDSTTTTVASQQNMFPHPAPNPLPPTQFNSENGMNASSAFHAPSDQNNKNFPTFDNVQQHNIQQSSNTSLAPVVTQSMHEPSLYPDTPQPKLLNLLSDTQSVLLDDDLDIQPWPATLAQFPASQPSHVQQTMAQQSHLNAAPVHQNSYPSQQNQPIAVTNFDNSSQQFSNFAQHGAPFPNQQIPQMPPQQFSLSGQNQPQISTHNSIENPPVIDLDSQQPFVTTSTFSSEAQNDPQSSTLIPGNNTFQNAVHGGDESLNNMSRGVETPSDYPTNHDGSTANVPNFLVPSSTISTETDSNQHQPNSFFNSAMPRQSPHRHPSLLTDQPSTPPTQRGISTGQPRFASNGNSPLSPSIYLSGKGPRQSRPGWTPMPRGTPSPHLRMRGPPMMNPSHPSPPARQRLFTPNQRGRPRGSRMAHPMMRPPSTNPVDDDVIVTAVVRGPMPPRPPMGQSQRGRGAPPPMPRGRGGYQRGRGGRPPMNSPSQMRKPADDVSRHFVDLACVVNPNEEMAGDEADEIQIVGVTPGKGGKLPPKAVDAKKFSYCCIHCGKDQGSKQVMKKHIKASHSDSLLGAVRNIESGQWLYFCPQLNCEFMTYDENRLTDHLYSCYNYDRSKQLPIDIQSALRNLKSLKIRQLPNAACPPTDVGGQGLRDAFNNNLKDAFDDMVENTIVRQSGRPNQPPQPPRMTRPPAHTSQRGAMRGPYPPRGNFRQRPPRPNEMPPTYQPRNPGMRGSPRHRYPPPNYQGRPRGPNQFPGQRGMAPARHAGPPMRGQRPPGRGFMPRPNVAGMPGNEQTPIIIDIDADSPENMGDGARPVATGASNNNTFMPVNQHPINPSQMMITPYNDIPQNTANMSNQGWETGALAYPQNQLSLNSDSHTVTNALNHHQNENNAIPPPSNGASYAGPIETLSMPNQQNEVDANSSLAGLLSSQSSSSQPFTTSSPAVTRELAVDPSTQSLEPEASPSQTAPPNTTENQTPISHSVQTSVGPCTALRDIPSPTQLMAEMNAMSKHQPGSNPSDATNSQNANNEEPNGADKPLPNEIPPSSNENDEELVNTILLDKVFAKVPHMPKKLSQRLVLKFKKYAADRGVIITPNSKVIDEFVSKISYKGSHSAPTELPDSNNRPNNENNQSSQLQTTVANPIPPVNTNTSATVVATTSTARPSPPSEAAVAVSNTPSLSQPSSTTPIPNSAVDDPSLQSSYLVQSQVPGSNPLPTADILHPDVIETKVIIPERNIKFSGAFADVVKAKVAPNSNRTSPDILERSDHQISPENLTSESTPLSSHLELSSISETQSVSAKSMKSTDKTSHEVLRSFPDTSHENIAKSLKKEIPMSFPSGSQDESIEVRSSVDHLVCGYASLEVDIAGKPLSSYDYDLEENEISPSVDTKKKTKELDFVSKDSVKEKVSFFDESSGKLVLKVKKNNKPRVPISQNKPEDAISEDSLETPSSLDGQSIRRSERKRKAVKRDYEPDALQNRMEELMSDEDEDYHMESDDSYDGSDSDFGAKKKVKKIKAVQDPTAFDLSIKGFYGCWKCKKYFSRVIFVKRHIMNKHKCGVCAILLRKSDDPVVEPKLLLFCPKNCKYVTSDQDAFSTHLQDCDKESLKTDGVEYSDVQKEFFNSEFQKIVSDIASGAISTIAEPKKSVAPRKKSLKVQSSADSEACSQQQNTNPTTTIVTTAVVHAPSQPVVTMSHRDQHEASEVHSMSNQMEMSHGFQEDNTNVEKPPLPHAYPGSDVHDQNYWDGYDDDDEAAYEENYNDFEEDYPYEDQM